MKKLQRMWLRLSGHLDVNIIGLEGELGSGKSTILKFLQKA